MSEVPIWETHLSEVAHEAARGGEIVYLTGNGQRLAAIVPADMAAAIEAHEDAEDLAAALAAVAEGGELIPAERVWAELGL
jgi:antitoxin Phd